MEIALGHYDLRFEHRPEFLVAQVCAPEDSVEVSLGFLREIAEECQHCKYQRVLIIEDLGTNLSTMQMYEVASRAPLLGAVGMTVAYVDLKAKHHELNLFGETVAVNRGVSVKFFRTVADAERWLLAEKKKGDFLGCHSDPAAGARANRANKRRAGSRT